MTLNASTPIEEIARNFNTADPALQDDPHPTLARLRAECPVAHSEVGGGYWVLSRQEDIHKMLSDPVTFSNAQGVTLVKIHDKAGPQLPNHTDPPEHTRYRRLLDPLFGPQQMRRFEDRTRELARELVERFVAKGGGDFIKEVAVPLPAQIYLLVMGLPLDQTEYLLELKEGAVRGILSGDPERIEYANKVARPALAKYAADALAERRSGAVAGDGVFDAMLKVGTEQDAPLTDNEIIRLCLVLLVAGLDTVTGSLGMMFDFLATHPEHRQAIVDDPTIIPQAVEELLRYESIINLGRTCTRDVEIGGQQIKAGEFVLGLTPSAGRDESYFPDADTVDFDRTPNRHIAFGAGPHRCLGSHLARMQLKVVLEEAHRLMPNYRLDEAKPPKKTFGVIMSVENLNLICEPPAAS